MICLQILQKKKKSMTGIRLGSASSCHETRVALLLKSEFHLCALMKNASTMEELTLDDQLEAHS